MSPRDGSRRRVLSQEERVLWTTVTKAIKPLRATARRSRLTQDSEAKRRPLSKPSAPSRAAKKPPPLAPPPAAPPPAPP